jgi:hypothetical protein
MHTNINKIMKEKHDMGHTGVDGRTILKWILKK